MRPDGRRPLVGGNWKMHMLLGEAEEYCRRFVAGLGDETAEVALFPSYPLLPTVAGGLAGSAAPARALVRSPAAGGRREPAP